MSEPRTAFVYFLRDPLRDYIPFYIGKGSHVSRRAQNRPKYHLLEAMRGKKSAKCERIREIVHAGEMYSVFVWQDNLTEDEAYDLEEHFIKAFGRENYDDDGILTNIVIDNRHIDYSKIVYTRGPDHHSYHVERPREHIEKQRDAWRKHAQLEGWYLCKCGCGVEIAWEQRNRASTDRQKHGIADWHFKTLPHNQAKSRKIKLLHHGLKEDQITPEMYLSKSVFNNIITES